MASALTRKEEAMRVASALIGTVLAPLKCLYLGGQYITLIDYVPPALGPSSASRITRAADARRRLLTEIGFTVLEIVPVVGSLIRQAHDMKDREWFVKRAAGYKASALDVFFGFKAKKVVAEAGQLFAVAQQIEAVTATPLARPADDRDQPCEAAPLSRAPADLQNQSSGNEEVKTPLKRSSADLQPHPEECQGAAPLSRASADLQKQPGRNAEVKTPLKRSQESLPHQFGDDGTPELLTDNESSPLQRPLASSSETSGLDLITHIGSNPLFDPTFIGIYETQSCPNLTLIG